MKAKVTKKDVRANYYRIIRIGYCDAQYLLNYKNPFGYSCGVYGWSCDYYVINGVCISTGYQPIGQQIDFNSLTELEKRACAISNNFDLSHDEKVHQIDNLLIELINLAKFE
jgi:hypothetical protein